MEFIKTKIADVILIQPKVFEDDRGFFLETFRDNVFATHGINLPFLQDNHSSTGKGILRGLHYQLRHPQGKLIRVISGSIFDVAVDLRKNSPTFSQWFGTLLSANNKTMIWIPPGCAHGFYSLENSECLYKCTGYYDQQDEHTLRWDDPTLGIPWPLEKGISPIVSNKDASGKFLSDAPLFS